MRICIPVASMHTYIDRGKFCTLYHPMSYTLVNKTNHVVSETTIFKTLCVNSYNEYRSIWLIKHNINNNQCPNKFN